MQQQAAGGRDFTQRARETLERLLQLMDCATEMEFFQEEEGILQAHLTSPDASRLIGKNAVALDALQYVLNRMLFKGDETAPRVVLDVEHYRERQKDRLLSYALSAADEVERTGAPVALSPMPAGERRTVHQALKNRDTVTTWSEETSDPGLKRVVIEPRV